MNRLKLGDFKKQHLTPQQQEATQKVLHYVLGNGPRRPRHCPYVVEGDDNKPPVSGNAGTVC